MMMNTLNNLRGRGRGRPHPARRRATLLAGLATLIGVPLVGALPVSADVGTAPTVVITPDPTASALPPVGSVDTPWVDQLHYTFEIVEDTPFFVFAYNPAEMERITSADLSDGVFSNPDSWDGLYLKPVDPSGVDTGLTTWELRGTLSSAQERQVTLRFSTGTELGGDTSTFVQKQVTVKKTGEQYLTRPEVETIQFGRDLKSVEVVFDVDLLEEDLEWNNSSYIAVPLPEHFQLTASSGPSIAFTSMEISGKTLIARFDATISSGTTYTWSDNGWSNSQGYGPYSAAAVKPDNFSGPVTAPSTTPPALDTETGPVVNADGDELTLTFDYPITSAAPDSSTLTVTAGGSAVAVSSIANSGATSVLTLASAISQGASVKVTYDAPASGGYQDAAGNLVAGFTDQAVTNNSTVTASATTATTTPGASSDDSASNDATTTTEAGSETTNTTPSLVTEENQAALTAAPGSAKALVNGEEVDLTVTHAGNTTAGETAPEERTAEQVAELQEAADSLIENLDEAAGGDSGLTVVDTDTGAEIEGIFDDARVPVEDVIVAETEEVAGLYASRDADGNVNKIRAELLETERGGEVAVYIYGLPAGEEAELVLMSTPYLLASATADSSGNFAEVVSAPDTVLAGDHTLVTASGTFSVSLGLRITDPEVADTVLPATGGEFPMAPVLFIIGLGSMMLVLTRRQESMGN